MHRVKGGTCLRARGLIIMAAATFAVAITSGSCVFDTETSPCGERRCAPGWRCALHQDVCVPVGGCGDGIVHPEEVCDDGDIESRDGCRSDCKSDETCGNGELDVAVGEGCDDGNRVPGDGCNADCAEEICGNLVLDEGEVCDDGNRDSFDGCRADCKSIEACGNGIVDLHLGETCEFSNAPFPGTVDDTAYCDSDCTVPVCGDGYLNTHVGELCDDGPADSQGCDGDCTFVTCGDGRVNEAVGEECEFPDLGSVRDMELCDGDCTLPVCGDKRTNPSAPSGVSGTNEQCDAGGDAEACDRDCTFPVCGDGLANSKYTPPGAPSPEQCDTGPARSDTAPNACRTNCQEAFCGDGVIDDGKGEECDPSDGMSPPVGCSMFTECIKTGAMKCTCDD